jgi:Base plate wedge protein 53
MPSYELDEVTYLENREPSRPLSRYNKYPILLTKQDLANEVSSVAVLETWDPIDIPELPTDLYVTVDPGEEHRLDLVAYRVYGSLSLYWVIAYANKMIDPFAETVAGKILRIPDRANLFSSVLVR